MFYDSYAAKGTLNIHNNPSSYYVTFYRAATRPNSGVIVNYDSSVTNIDNIINTKANTSNVVKGEQLD